MRIGRLLWVGVALQVGAASGAGTNAVLNSASSVSRQFTAYAPGPILPVALCSFAERVKREWLDRLAATDNWRDPILLVFREDPASNPVPAAIQLGVVQVGPVVKYEIRGRVPPVPAAAALAPALVEALCLETANRDRPAVPGPWAGARIPLWLVQGLTGLIQGDTDWLRLVAQRSAAAARPPALTEVLDRAELPADDVARDLFLANAWLLTDNLLRLPDGGRKLARWLAELRTTEDAFAKVYRSDFPNPVAREKWWSLVQAHLATIVIPQDLTARETARQLGALLIMADGQPFTNLYRNSDQVRLRQAVAKRVDELENLRSRAHPLYQPALAAYSEAGRCLVADQGSRYRRAVARAEQLRLEARRRTEAISVTLDWAEQKYSPGGSSNVWAGYFQTLERLENLQREHHDPIGDYLDKFDK